MKSRPTFFSERLGLAALAVAGALLVAPPLGRTASCQERGSGLQTGRDLFQSACANCHGSDGKGASQSLVGFNLPIRDFTDCQAAAREPDSDWAAVALQGGPARGFSELMPAFTGLLTVEEVSLIVDYLRTFCTDAEWPRGELNLPRALVSEKAFPEDEAVLTTAVETRGMGLITNEIVYEQRLGRRNQIEISVPFGWRKTVTEAGKPDWTSNLGDLAVGVKRVLYHSFEHGAILSATAEVIMPTGDESRGFGKGTFILEPFVSYGQLLPADFFLQAQAGMELPAQSQKAEKEGFLRFAFGRSFDTGRWGRSWSPMVELLGARELRGQARIDWDVVPQLQVTLNRRKNIMASLGVRFPLNNASGRNAAVIFYLLWDWFDGTLFQGW